MGEESGAGHGTPPAALTAIVVKGKRSKRRRVHATAAVIAVTTPSAAGELESSSSSVADGGGWRSVSGADEAASGCVTEEEEDMALCLMLLARGGGGGSSRAGPSSSSSSVMVVAPDAADSTAGLVIKDRKFRSRRPADGGEGEFVYECRTCGKCFPSFQALGGHRTSHKKPRLPLPPTTATATSSEEKKLPPVAREKTPGPSSPSPESHATSAVDRTVLAIPVPATPPKQEGAATATGGSSKQQQQQGQGHGQGRVHECSICGAEFGSGQALGGHMRRHRPLLPASASMSSADDVAAVLVIRKEKSLLELDLNMPAPCDDPAATEATSPGSFTFAAKERPPSAALLPFPARSSALVDCHY